MNLIYRKLKKEDYPDIKNLINKGFGLYRYVDSPDVLMSWLNVYLQSCLAEETFSCVAEQNGKVVGVIMGKAESDYRYATHVKPILSTGYHSLLTQLKASMHKNDITANKKMHKIYHELHAGCSQKFDGVLTLFIVSEECRGMGVGKKLLRHLMDYQQSKGTNNIYLYTDSSCNYKFYEAQGFKRLGSQSLTVMQRHKPVELGVYLYGSACNSTYSSAECKI